MRKRVPMEARSDWSTVLGSGTEPWFGLNPSICQRPSLWTHTFPVNNGEPHGSVRLVGHILDLFFVFLALVVFLRCKLLFQNFLLERTRGVWLALCLICTIPIDVQGNDHVPHGFILHLSTTTDRKSGRPTGKSWSCSKYSLTVGSLL